MDVLGDDVVWQNGSQSRLAAHIQPHTVVLAYCSASWCGPCKAFTPRLAEVSAAFPHVLVVFVSLDRTPAAFKAYYASMPATWAALPYDAAHNGTVFGQLGGSGIPYCVMVRDATGHPRAGSVNALLLANPRALLGAPLPPTDLPTSGHTQSASVRPSPPAAAPADLPTLPGVYTSGHAQSASVRPSPPAFAKHQSASDDGDARGAAGGGRALPSTLADAPTLGWPNSLASTLRHPRMEIISAASGERTSISAAFIFLLFSTAETAAADSSIITGLTRWLAGGVRAKFGADVLFVPLHAERARALAAGASMPWFMVDPACALGGCLATTWLARLLGVGEQLPLPALVLLDADGKVITRDGTRRLVHESATFPWTSVIAPRRVLALDTELGTDVYGCAWAFVLFSHGQPPPAIMTELSAIPKELRVDAARVKFCLADSPSALATALRARIEDALTSAARALLVAFSFPTGIACVYTAQADIRRFVSDVLQGASGRSLRRLPLK
jgi:thiol-disulfide isomerase/thioredoxin